MVWSRSDRPARMQQVEWSLDAQFRQSQKVLGPYALETSDYTARQDLTGLPAGQEVHVRVSFQSLDNLRAWSEPTAGPLRGSAVRHGENASAAMFAPLICAFSGEVTRRGRAGASTPSSVA